VARDETLALDLEDHASGLRPMSPPPQKTPDGSARSLSRVHERARNLLLTFVLRPR
jgi:hypothetical protein